MGNEQRFEFVLERIRTPERIVLDKPEQKYMCGRGKENHIVCSGRTVSRKHCVFQRKRDSLYVTDLKSSNGIFINGVAQESLETLRLDVNDIIGIGCPDVEALEEDMYAYRICITHVPIASEKPNCNGVSDAVPSTSAIDLSPKDGQDTLSRRKREKKIEEIVVPKKIPKIEDNKTILEQNAPENDEDKSWKGSLTRSKKKILAQKKKDEADIEVVHVSLNGDLSPTSSNRKELDNENTGSERMQLDNIDKEVSIHDEETPPSTQNRVSHEKSEQSKRSPENCSNRQPSSKSGSTEQKRYNIGNTNSKSTVEHGKDKSKGKAEKENNEPNTFSKETSNDHSKSTKELQAQNKKSSVSRALVESDVDEFNPTFVESDGMLIKMEQELQLVDDDEQAIWNSKSLTKSPLKTPLKLKQVKQQEHKTRFSEIDVVNLSDDENDVFPCSQLFHTDFGSDVPVKAEVKQEPDDEDNAEFNKLEDEDIIALSDSEDEDNPWLQKLSRSQILNESSELLLDTDKKETANDVGISVKLEEKTSDFNVDVQNASSRTKDTVTITSSTVKPVPAVETKSETAEVAEPEVASSWDVEELLGTDDEEEEVPPPLRKEKSQSKENLVANAAEPVLNKVPEKVLDCLEKTCSVRMARLSLQKKIPEIEAPYLPKKRRSTGSLTIGSKTAVKTQNAPRLTTKEKQELKKKSKIEEHMYVKEQKYRKVRNKWADCLPPGKKKTTPLTKEEKKLLSDTRKEKLKQLAEEKKVASDAGTEKKRTHKVKAKVTAKTRGDLLIADQLNLNASKASIDESSEKTKTSNASLTSKITNNVQAKAAASKEVIDKVTRNLSHSLRFSDLPEKIKIPKKKNTTVSNVTAATGENTVDVLGEILRGQTLTLQKIKGSEPTAETRTSKTLPPPETAPADKLAQTVPRIVINNLQKSCLRKSTGGKKKRVSFRPDIKTVHEYQVETNAILRKIVGKDLPIPEDKLTHARVNQKIVCRRLDEILLKMFYWNPVWLEEQKRLNSTPPLVREEDIYPLLTRYKSYDEYYKIFTPLLLLEIWSSITNDFESVDANRKRPTMMCTVLPHSIRKVDIPTTNLCYMSFEVQVLVTKEQAQQQAHPVYGDLVMLEFQKIERDKKIFQKVFAYVENIIQSTIHSGTFYNAVLNNYVSNPHTLMTYSLMTRPLEGISSVDQALRLRAVTYIRPNLRLFQALQYLPKSPLLNQILNPQIESYKLPHVTDPHTRTFVTKDELNTKQREAVLRISETVLQRESKICFVQGPPGTGKSKVIVNMVTQIVNGGGGRHKSNSLRILLCAPSNAAIDEIVLRLLNVRSSMPKQDRFKMVRIGRVDSMHPNVRDISATNLGKRYANVESNNYAATTAPLESVQEEKSYLEAKINGLKFALANSQSTPETHKNHNKYRLTELIRKYELLTSRTAMNDANAKQPARSYRSAEATVIKNANIIACTLSSCFTGQMESIFGSNRERISVCIVDEATQSCETETLIPLMLGVTTLVLVGDTNQLPATILNTRAKRLGLDQSIFSRVQSAFEEHPNSPIIMLNTQYRMACPIAYWPNKFFYGGKLRNEANPPISFPFNAYRVLNLNAKQSSDKFLNLDEAEFVATLIVCMMKSGNLENWEPGLSFGVLTPYTKQRGVVLSKINEKIASVPNSIRKKMKIEVNTVDGFQGQERDIVIMSCVRSDGIGFLSDRQRLCVALTRAKYSLILCGNFHTFMKDEMWKALLTDAHYRKVYHTINVNSERVVNDIKECVVKSAIPK